MVSDGYPSSVLAFNCYRKQVRKMVAFSFLVPIALASTYAHCGLASLEEADTPSQKLTRENCTIVTEGFCIPNHYNKLQRPNTSEPLNVQVASF